MRCRSQPLKSVSSLTTLLSPRWRSANADALALAWAVAMGCMVGPNACTNRSAVVGSATSATIGNGREDAELGVEGEHRVRDRDVASIPVGQHDDAACFADPSQRDVGTNPRISESVDDVRVMSIRDRLDHRPSQLGRIDIGEDDDRVRLRVRVGEDELLDDRWDATRAAEDHQMSWTR